jgi:DNA-binding Lrp family transcriptional regulator
MAVAHNSTWKESDIEYLKANCSRKTPMELAKELNQSEPRVRDRLRKLGLEILRTRPMTDPDEKPLTARDYQYALSKGVDAGNARFCYRVLLEMREHGFI